MASPSNFQAAFARRSLQNITTELEFLHSSGAITRTAHNAILAQLPQPHELAVPALTDRNEALQIRAPDADNSHSVPPPPVHTYAAPSGPPPGYSSSGPAPYPTEKAASGSGLGPGQEPRIGTAIALFPYDSADPEDLKMSKDDSVAVLRHENADWSYGINDRTGQRGIFPRGYVRFEAVNGGSNSSNNNNNTAITTTTTSTDTANYHASYGNMPMQVTAGGSGAGGGAPGAADGAAHGGGKGSEMGKKFGKKLGNAAIFGAGATIGSNIVNSIF